MKLEDLSNLMQDIRSAFLTPDSPQDEPIIVLDESEEEETKRYEDTHTTSHNRHEDTSIPHPTCPKSVQIQELILRRSYPDINQLTKLLVTSLKHEISKLLASHDFASCLSTELKELPLKITELYGDVKELKKHAGDMEIKLPGDLKEIPKKLETFISTISSLTSQPHKSIIPAEGEKNTYSATKESNLKNDLVDLKGIDVVEEYHKKKLLILAINTMTRVCENKAKPLRSTNCGVCPRRGGGGTRFLASEGDRGTSTLKVYREDRTNEVISNFKVSDLHLAGERYLEDQDHFYFSLCGGTKNEDKTLARASVQLG
ncbi:hypothetical protein Tco_0468011 [Tanacetum coccineum]